VIVVWLSFSGTVAFAQDLTADQQAAMVLSSAQRAFLEKNYPFAIERFREFIAKYGGHKDAVVARYGLGVALQELPENRPEERTKNFNAAIEALQQPAGQGDFVDRPFALYYLGMAHRGLGHQFLALALAKPPEAPQHRPQALERFGQAVPQFTQAAVIFTERAKKPVDPNQPGTQASDAEWAARCRCDEAEMQLQNGKFAEAKAAAELVLTDPILAKSRYERLARYYSGYASFSLKDYLATGKTLGPLAPFGDPAFGNHTRYLLGRTHHLSDERPEAMTQYEAVLAGYDAEKIAAQKTLQDPNRLKDNPDERIRLEALMKDPPPEFVARAAYFQGILLSEQGKFSDALAIFTTFPQKFPNSPWLKEVELRKGICQVQLKQLTEAIKTLPPLQDQQAFNDQVLWWLGRAQARHVADPNNPQQVAEALRVGIDTMKRAADRANQMVAQDPTAKFRRGEMLMDVAETQQQAKQFNEAAAVYAQILNEKLVTTRAEEALALQATALQLGGKYKESDDVCVRFQQTHPQSVLLPAVLFRHAENAYLVAATAANTPNLPNRDAELAKLFGEAIKRYQPVIEKYPEFDQINLARQSLATSHYQIGQFEEAAKVFETIADADRSGPLATVPYLLADCHVRTMPTSADDALSAAKLSQQLEQAIKLLEGFVASATAPGQPNPPRPEVPDALLKLGFCQQLNAGLTAEPTERQKQLAVARQTYERLMQQFANHPLMPMAVFERSKCMADQGDINGAMNELVRFQHDPLKNAPIAPQAWLRLSAYLRAQNKAVDAEKLLAQCRAQYEGAMNADPLRVAWVPLIQYHHGMSLRESNKLPEARALFENIAKQHAARPEGPEAAWRAGQCRREEQMARMKLSREAIAKPGAKPEEITAAKGVITDALNQIKATAQYFQEQAQQLAAKSAGTEPHLRMLYEGAWCHRILAEAEVEAARLQLEQDALKKAQDEAAKKAKPGEPPPVVRVAPIEITAIPAQPSEQKSRELYQAVVNAAADHVLALESRLELAELQSQRREYAAAIPVLGAALDADPPMALAERIRLRLGSCYQALEQYPDAFGQFDAVAQNATSPLAPEARCRAAECLLQQQDFQGAIKLLTPFRDLGPLQNISGVTDRALLRLGHALAQAQQWDQSRQAFEILVQRFGQSPWVDEARYGMGWALQNQKQFDNAVNTYAQVTSRTATETAAKAQLQIGLCRLEQKRLPEAANALLIVPFTYDYPELSATALCEASRVLLELKQPQEASRLLQRVLKDHPEGKWADVAKERLQQIK
jgi:tetratricopeptide (TPR) repeat protein